MQREMELEDEDDEDDMEEVVPVMGSGDDAVVAEEYAAEIEGETSEAVEWE